MPANLFGLALREAVATKVMGLTCWWNGRAGCYDIGRADSWTDQTITGYGIKFCPEKMQEILNGRDEYAYELEISAAWLALTHFENRPSEDGCNRWYWRIEATALGYDCSIWYAGGDTDRPRLKDIHVKRSGKTVPIAICLATLAVKEWHQYT